MLERFVVAKRIECTISTRMGQTKSKLLFVVEEKRNKVFPRRFQYYSHAIVFTVQRSLNKSCANVALVTAAHTHTIDRTSTEIELFGRFGSAVYLCIRAALCLWQCECES